MRRRSFLGWLAAHGLALAVTAVGLATPGPLTPPVFADGATCPRCGAPREPGAAFCGNCGFKFQTTAEAATPARRPEQDSVVQVVTIHDNELTSTFGSLAYESNIRVDSILGSAFPVGPGEFVTDSGLLVGAKQVSLRTRTCRTIPATVIGSDAMIGVALLKADVPEISALSLRADEPARPGETIRAIGYPSGEQAGKDLVVSTGVVSGLHRGAAGIHPIEDYLQTDASLPRGLAGGPMVDAGGRVVGMSTGFVLGTRVLLGPQSGIGLAVPAEWVARSLAWIRSGAPPRVWIGAFAVTADPESRAEHKLPPDAKLYIDQIFPGSPAASAGLKRGDGLLKIQGDPVADLPRIQQRLLDMHPGDRVDLEISRAGEKTVVPTVLAPRPDKPRLAGIDALRFYGGVHLEPEGERLAVASVLPGTEVAREKIARGDVLQSVLSKKDWVHGAKDNSRWRSVHGVDDLEKYLATAYSDFDFCLVLRFRTRAGEKRELLVWEILTPTGAL